jgi:F-type H+-transporting ATPase subunit epsilon
MVTVPGSEGDFSVLEGHAPFMATLRNGPLTIYAANGAAPETIEVEGGFAEVNEAGLTVLAEHIAS